MKIAERTAARPRERRVLQAGPRPQEERQVRDWLRAEAAAMEEFADVSVMPAPRPVAVGDP